MDFINQMKPVFDEKEKEALNDYMMYGGWGTEFKQTRRFEQMIMDYTGAMHCWIAPSGTLGLVCALAAVGVGNGDEVIVPDYTMVATPNAVHLLGGKAVFVDIDKKSLCMDFEKMQNAVTDKTKAVILVSINGRYPSELERFISFCKEKEIHFIEDAAQSLGSFCRGKHLGRFGEIGVFSFSAPKIITTGQGGALITDDNEIAERIKKIRDFGRESGGSDHYLTMGWNFKFSDFQAVIGIEQMKKLPDRVKRKKQMGQLYSSLLNGIPDIELINTDFNDTAPWFFDILCNDRAELKEYLKGKGIGSREFYPPLHSEPVYDYQDLNFPVTEEISKRGLWLPSGINITDEQIHYICDEIKMFYSGR